MSKLTGSKFDVLYAELAISNVELDLDRFNFHDAHVVSWLAFNFWTVIVGSDGEWRFA